MAYKRWKPLINYIKSVSIEQQGNAYYIFVTFADGGWNSVGKFPFEKGNKREQSVAKRIAEEYAKRIRKAGEYVEKELS